MNNQLPLDPLMCPEYIETIVTITMATLALEEPDMPENLKIISAQHLEDMLHETYNPTDNN